MKTEKPQGTKRYIDLNILREQGFIVEVENNPENSYVVDRVVLIAINTRKGTVIKDEVAAELEMTYGVKKTNAVQKQAVRLLNALAFNDALKRATK